MLVTDLRKPVGEIADELGYAQLPDFTRFFKKHCGHLPVQYRKLHLEGKSVHL